MADPQVEYRRGEYRKSAARREQILEAATEVFGQAGFTASSLSEVARRVGMTQAGILHHFKGGKTALLTAILDKRDERALAILSGRRGIEMLRGLLVISAAQKHQRGIVQMYRLLSTEALNAEHPAYEHFRRRHHSVAAAVEQAFREAREDGDAHPDIDPRVAAISTMAMTEGTEVLWLNGLDVDIVEDVRGHMQTFLSTPL